jgi:integrase/recombinase XerD
MERNESLDLPDAETMALPEPRRRGRPRARERMAITPLVPAMLGVAGSDTPAPAREAIVAGQWSANTRRAYEGDVLLFQRFLDAVGRAHLADVTRDDLIAYRGWLAGRYAPATVNRRLSVVRSLFREALLRGEVERDPSVHLKLLRVADESPTESLDGLSARALLDGIDRSTLLGLRDAAILSLLIRTGLRRSEIGGLTVASLGTERGHHTLSVRGKGDKRRIVKVPVDVWHDIERWLEARTAIERQDGSAPALQGADPLFVEVRKVGHGQDAHYRAVGQTGLTPDAIWIIVKRHTASAGIAGNITPHSLRHTFITLALEGRAPLHKVQYAAGHADPRTTERYHRRKENLDDNATDYIKI